MGQPEGGVRAIGADGCRGGWIAALGAGEPSRESVSFRLFGTVAELATWRATDAPDAVVALDVPMGLTEIGGFRPCDLAARKALGALASSVFAPPGRYLLSAASYTEVRRLVEERQHYEPAAPGLSAQSAGIIPKIAEVDRFLRETPAAQDWLIEVHPELCFAALAGEHLPGKRSAAGAVRRLRLVRDRFPGAEEALSTLALPATSAGFDDALDACAALWSALRWGNGATVIGGEVDAKGLVMRMVV